jgi:hypothetical protein
MPILSVYDIMLYRDEGSRLVSSREPCLSSATRQDCIDVIAALYGSWPGCDGAAPVAGPSNPKPSDKSILSFA